MFNPNSFWIQTQGPESLTYELSMLAAEFFPQAEITSEHPEAVFVLENGGWVLGNEKQSLPPMDTPKNAAKRGLYQLLCRLTGQTLPWGILTGVRPTKLIFDDADAVTRLTRDFEVRADKAALAQQIARTEKQLLVNHTPEDVSVYVGIPFCPTRCAYCSFVSYDFHAHEAWMERYVACLISEISAFRTELHRRPLQSFYMGGGTPTTLDPQSLRRVLTAVAPQDFKEVTVEAGRPDTITAEKLRVLKEFGIDRISVNPQTMNQKTLDRIGRAHTVEDTLRAYALAREEGFDNINMDLIVGLPGEDLGDVEHTMRVMEELRPDSLTVHTLAIKRASNLRIDEGYQSIAQAELIDRMVRLGAQTAQTIGLTPYYMYRQKNMAGNFENVGYARPGKECLYNIEIMEERQSILAFGAGGVSKIFTPALNRIDRVANVKNISEYCNRIEEMIERKKGAFT